MISPNPETWTVTSLSKALRKREISPVEITHKYLERIKAHDSQINSFITLLPQEALRAARLSEKEILRGKYRGPLHGIPFAAKDLFYTKGIRTTCGSKILKNFVPAYHATVIERLLAAGAILLGKLNMHEFAYGTTSVNPHYGPVRNPWDRERVTGGSSGGSAAALASSFVPLTLGTDTGGSIRIPSALCGTAGLKPTYGRISRYGVYPLCWSLDHPGPMTRSVADLAMAMNVLAGPDPLDPSTSPVAVPDYPKGLSNSLKGIRVGIPDTYYFDRLDPEVHAAVRKAIWVCKGLGAAVKKVSIPHLPEASVAAFIILLAEGAASLEKWHRTRPLDMGDDVPSLKERLIFKTTIKGLLPDRKDWQASSKPIARGTLIGFFLGILPGPGNIISSFVSYSVEKRFSKRPEDFGKGAIEGVAGPESANNAATAGAFIPLLTLGIPTSATMALLLGALRIHGVIPGPLLLERNPEIFWGVIASMYVGNILLLILNLPLIGIWVKLLKVPYGILFPLILLFCLIGAYAGDFSVIDINVMIFFGILGYLMRKTGYEPAPLVFAYILCPIWEEALRQSFMVGYGDMMIFFKRPISAVLLSLSFFFILTSLLGSARRNKLKKAIVGGQPS